jgi:hypothetical protein
VICAAPLFCTAVAPKKKIEAKTIPKAHLYVIDALQEPGSGYGNQVIT